MTSELPIKLYYAYTSPYSYLAVKPARSLEQTHRVRLRWIPFGVHIREVYKGVESTGERGWRKVRYLYRDARRFAREQGLVILGPEKIYNAKLAMIAGLYADKHERLHPYTD